jgi:hypothetical protein
MRIFALVLALLFAVPWVPAHAQTAGAQAQPNVEDLRTTVRGALNQSRQFLLNVYNSAQDATGLNNEQVYGVGVGLLSGLLVADLVGTGGLGTMVWLGAGGLVGKWATTGK